MNTAPAVGAPSLTRRANTSTTVIVVSGAFLGNENTRVQNRAEAIFGFVSQTLSAVIVGIATGWDLDAFFCARAEAESSIAILFAFRAIINKSVSIHTVAALVSSIGFIRSFVLVTEVDLGEASLLVISNEVSGLAKITNLLSKVDGTAVRNSGNTRKSISSDVESVEAGLTFQGFGSESRGFVGDTSVNFGQASFIVSSKHVPIVASLTEVLVAEVDTAVVDLSQTKVSFGAKSGEIFVAFNAKSQAVVNQTVSDRSGFALSPVGRLSVSGSAPGTKVGTGNVGIAVRNTLQATVIDQKCGVGAAKTNSGGSVSAVVSASWNVSDDDADLTVAEVITLFASNTVALVIDAGAVGVTASHTIALHSEIKSVDVTGHAVKAVFVPEDTAVARCRRSDHRVLRVAPDDHQAQRESEDR